MLSRQDDENRSRKAHRLKGWDHSQSAAYFVTLCSHDKACIFGRVTGLSVRLNPLGKIVQEEWFRSEDMRRELSLDAFVVMPNHLHGIVVINSSEFPFDPDVADHWIYWRRLFNAQYRVPRQTKRGLRRRPKSLSSFIAGFKAATTRRIRKEYNDGIHVWQRNYWDRVLRSRDEFEAARKYIAANPRDWHNDPEYLRTADR